MYVLIVGYGLIFSACSGETVEAVVVSDGIGWIWFGSVDETSILRLWVRGFITRFGGLEFCLSNLPYKLLK